MDCVVIEIPEKNDSISRVVLDGVQYFVRFTYNDTFDYWTFGLMDALENPILSGVKIVPNYPINLFAGTDQIPAGIFAVLTELERVGHDDFKNGLAQFVYVPENQS